MNVRERAKVWQLERAIRAVGKRGMIVSLCLLTLLGTMVTGSFTQVLAGGGTDWTIAAASDLPAFAYGDADADVGDYVSATPSEIKDELAALGDGETLGVSVTVGWKLNDVAPAALRVEDTFTLAPISFGDLAIDFSGGETTFDLTTDKGLAVGKFTLQDYTGSVVSPISGPSKTFAITVVFTGNLLTLANPVGGEFRLEFALNKSGEAALHEGSADATLPDGNNTVTGDSDSWSWTFDLTGTDPTATRRGGTVFKTMGKEKNTFPYFYSNIWFNTNRAISNTLDRTNPGTVVIKDTFTGSGLAPLYVRSAADPYGFYYGDGSGTKALPVDPDRGIYGTGDAFADPGTTGYFRLVNINWDTAWQALYEVQQKGTPAKQRAFGYYESGPTSYGNGLTNPAGAVGLAWKDKNIIPDNLRRALFHILSAVWGDPGNTDIQANNVRLFVDEDWETVLKDSGAITPVTADLVESIRLTDDGLGFEIVLKDQAITEDTLFLSYVNEVRGAGSAISNKVNVSWNNGSADGNASLDAKGVVNSDSSFNDLTIKKFLAGEDADTDNPTSMAGAEFSISIYSAYDSDNLDDNVLIRDVVASGSIGPDNSLTTTSLGEYSKDDFIVITEEHRDGYEDIDPIVLHIDPTNNYAVTSVTENTDSEGVSWFTAAVGGLRHTLVTVWNKLTGGPPVTVTISAQKSVETDDGDVYVHKGGIPEFSFGLYAADADADADAILSEKNDEHGNIAISFDLNKVESGVSAGEYTYTLKEIAGSSAGWGYDTTAYTVIVTVVADADGALSATVAYADADGKPLESDAIPTFTNTYTIGEHESEKTATATVEASKEVTDDGENSISTIPDIFEFELYEIVAGDDAESGPKEVWRKTVTNAAGSVAFNVTYAQDAVGEFWYTIREKTGDAARWAYDDTKYTVKVVVVSEGDGVRVASIAYYEYDAESDNLAGAKLVPVEGEDEVAIPTFTNTYTGETPAGPKVEVIINAKKLVKTATGGAYDTETNTFPTFSFGLYETDKTIATASGQNEAENIALKFGLSNVKAGDKLIYTLKETGGLTNWTYDTTAYTVTVTVVADGAGDPGSLTATVEYAKADRTPLEPNDIVFTNTYTPGGGGGGGGGGDEITTGGGGGGGGGGGTTTAEDDTETLGPNNDTPLGSGITDEEENDSDPIVEIDANDDTPLGSGTDLSDENGADEVIDLDASDGAPLGGLPKTGENSPLIWFWSGCGILLLFMAILRVRKLPPTRKDL